ncbi:expressed unknown protein [Seminavis robusta]|uniref:Uncharacterized protein n=1 Tax=Seminavis robusta TaxID=568900 RepID=A0A9N8EV04_9STRA|nr:expressed unknown protein [Seminavis robusta]|eukprot:Sro1842_g301070.1 n/a (212) ;mRNA; r:12859-13494
MIVIPSDTSASAPLMPLSMSSPLSPVVASVSPLKDDAEPIAPRRVSFRTNEIEQQRIAFLVQSTLVEDDEEDETDCQNISKTISSPLVVKEEEETTSRGLELKTSPARQTRKFTILKSIVKNQKHCSPEQLSKLARVCNRWAAVAAKAQADQDFHDVYQPSSAAAAAPQIPDMARYPMPFKKNSSSSKRSSSSSSSSSQEEHTRRVRARTH